MKYQKTTPRPCDIIIIRNAGIALTDTSKSVFQEMGCFNPCVHSICHFCCCSPISFSCSVSVLHSGKPELTARKMKITDALMLDLLLGWETLHHAECLQVKELRSESLSRLAGFMTKNKKERCKKPAIKAQT